MMQGKTLKRQVSLAKCKAPNRPAERKEAGSEHFICILLDEFELISQYVDDLVY